MTNERSVWKNTTLALALLGLMPASIAQAAEITSLMSKELTDIPGREVLMLTVDKAPGPSGSIHQAFPTLHLRNYAHGFIYMLEASMKMQAGRGMEVMLTPGQTWYEGPHDVHSMGRNASSTKPVKFLVSLVKDKGVR